MASTQGLFVTGTDTDVGKSLVSCALVRMLRAQTVDAVGFKPVATGEVGGSWGDAAALHDASGHCEPIEKICPLRFALPLAPTLAAAREGIDPDLDLARVVLAGLCERHPAVIIEGVGGLLVPVDRKTLVADFAREVGFPVLLVCRAGLGTINLTLLTLREMARHNLRVAGIVMNVTRASDAALAAGSREEIERLGGHRVIALIPHLGFDEDPDAPRSALVARAIAALDGQLDPHKLLGTRESETPRTGRRGERRSADRRRGERRRR